MPQLIDNIKDRISQYTIDGKLSNEDLVQIIELCGSYLNLKTRSQYAKESGISYNGAKKFRQNIQIFGTTFIIDNE